MRDGIPIGVFTLQRRKPEPYTQQQIELVTTFADQAVIAIENARLFEEVQARTADLSVALEQQTATAKVLQVISRSTFDLQTVLDTLVESATRLCEADHSWLFLREDAHFRWAAGFGHATEVHERLRDFFKPLQVPVDRGSVTGRAALEARVVHVPDLIADQEYTWGAAQKIGGYRAALGVPLLREGSVVGVIFVGKVMAQAFTATQIDLVTTFADQAVIAIENVRLFDQVQARTEELSEALKQQTATADVLKVISRSTFDLQTVLDTLAHSAAQLCDADMAAIHRLKGTESIVLAHYGFPPDYVSEIPRNLAAAGRGTLAGRVTLEGEVVEILDVLADPEYSLTDSQRRTGFRTLLGAPLLREGSPVGVIIVFRKTVRPFTTKQVELLETFADQAVIAIENVRLFEEVQARTAELQQSLEYQTATGDVLNVISRSPSEIQPVLDTIVETAGRLCDAYDAIILLREGDSLKVAAHRGPIPVDFGDWPIGRGWVTGRAVVDRRPIHIHDLAAEGDEFPDGHAMALRLGHRTILAAPLMRENVAIGAIAIRRTETRPFSEKQVAVLQTFADQAVIAIENVRLFEEVQARTREISAALEQQTATSEVLQIISRSKFDLQPVLKTLVETAARLCQAENVQIWLRQEEIYCLVAHNGFSPEYQEYARQHPIRPSRGTLVARTALEGARVHIHDVLSDPEYTWIEGQRLAGFRAALGVPLLREGSCLGVMAMSRAVPRPFSDKQIDLVTTFADQAVIAIENVRLFEEVQARTHEVSVALEQQTATAEVLKVISRSAFDLQKVLDTLVESATRLCDADFSLLFMREGEEFRWSTSFGQTADVHERVEAYFKSRRISIDRGSITGRAALEAHVVHVSDVLADPDYTWSEAQRISGYRAAIGVPLFREQTVIGVIFVGERYAAALHHRSDRSRDYLRGSGGDCDRERTAL